MKEFTPQDTFWANRAIRWLQKKVEPKKQGTMFYKMDDNVFLSSSDLHNYVDDTAKDVWIATPKGWKCSREDCTIDYKHEHSSYNNSL